MFVFGPVPSRRLGRSLGINNIPLKHCTYSCIYCQLGLTSRMNICRKKFISPVEIIKEVGNKFEKLKAAGEKIDFITFVPDGEPTLDINLGKEILLLKTFRLKIAVITNASLLWIEEVRNDLMNADWISIKIDTVDEEIWHKINRPNGKLEFQKILSGIRTFASFFKGMLVTETMLVKGINDNIDSLRSTTGFIRKINPAKAYILVPIRPPAEKSVEPPSEENLNLAYQIFHSQINDVELLAYSEGTDFSYTSDVEKELLSILAVHPMRKDAVEKFINKSNSDWNFIKNLIGRNKIREVYYNHSLYYTISN
jgi:wyosine [tRNA(Phe)-imidazoG37] synthetase (radical SAM superfamily)